MKPFQASIIMPVLVAATFAVAGCGGSGQSPYVSALNDNTYLTQHLALLRPQDRAHVAISDGDTISVNDTDIAAATELLTPTSEPGVFASTSGASELLSPFFDPQDDQIAAPGPNGDPRSTTGYYYEEYETAGLSAESAAVYIPCSTSVLLNRKGTSSDPHAGQGAFILMGGRAHGLGKTGQALKQLTEIDTGLQILNSGSKEYAAPASIQPYMSVYLAYSKQVINVMKNLTHFDCNTTTTLTFYVSDSKPPVNDTKRSVAYVLNVSGSSGGKPTSISLVTMSYPDDGWSETYCAVAMCMPKFETSLAVKELPNERPGTFFGVTFVAGQPTPTVQWNNIAIGSSPMSILPRTSLPPETDIFPTNGVGSSILYSGPTAGSGPTNETTGIEESGLEAIVY